MRPRPWTGGPVWCGHHTPGRLGVTARRQGVEQARRLLGDEPRVDLEEGLARTADWYRQENLL